MRCVALTGSGADTLSHCDEKHCEMMWRECTSCPQRDGGLWRSLIATCALVCVVACFYLFVCVCVCVCVVACVCVRVFGELELVLCVCVCF